MAGLAAFWLVAACASDADATLNELYEQLAASRFVHVPHAEMRHVFTAFDAGFAEGLPSLGQFWDGAVPQRDEHGADVYPYKGTLVGYYSMDTAAGAFNARRSQSHDFDGQFANDAQCSTASVVEHIDPTTANAARAENGTAPASYFRVHKAWPLDADSHPVVRAAQRMLYELLRRHWSARGQAEAGFECMMTAFRVSKSDARHGEPGPEGVHQDSALLTAVLLVGRRNLTSTSGGNRVWALEQPSGKPSAADVASPRLLWNGVLLEPLDALFVLDREAKHEALPIVLTDGVASGERDVLTFECRQP